MITRTIFAVAMTTVCMHSTLAADAPAGKAFFRAQCGLCHSAEPNDNGGAQGPSLQGVFGRKAATGDFSYTEALKDSNLTWDATTLDRFLSNPVGVVPGSAMVVPVPGAEDRANVIAYFEALSAGTYSEPQRTGGGPGGFGPPPAASPPAGDPEWKKDAPGVVHRVDLANLPAPYATASANNFPRLVAKPPGAELKLPEGFKVDVFATGLQAPRAMVIAPNGDVFLSETQSGRIKVIRPSVDGSSAEQITVFAQGLLQPLGIAFQPADNPQWVYIAETNRVVRYPYKNGDTVASAVPEVIIPQLSAVGGGHYTRDIAFSPDGERMFVSVGSQSNVAEGLLEPKTPAQIQAWEREHGLGAPWGDETNRAMVRVYEVGSGDIAGKTFATGIRNCVGLTVQPATGELWCTTNERDMLGDDLVPDYSTRVKEGAFYGWPWYYMGNHEDPRHAGARPDLAGKATVPDVPYTAHSASVDLEFYPSNPTGSSAFPAEYAGEGFAVLHGSWNRGHRTGHKIVRLPMQDGVPTGEYIDFMTGFITEDGNAWGRPVAIVVARDGSLLLSDDGANVIYRISHTE